MSGNLNPHRHASPVADRAGAATPPAAPATNSDALERDAGSTGSAICNPSDASRAQPAGGEGCDCPSIGNEKEVRPASLGERIRSFSAAHPESTARQIADALGTTPPYVRRAMERDAKPSHSVEQISRIGELLKGGFSASQIGAQVGMTRNAVVGMVHRHKTLKAIGFKREPGGHSVGKSVSVKANRKHGAPGGIAGRKLVEARRKAKKEFERGEPREDKPRVSGECPEAPPVDGARKGPSGTAAPIPRMVALVDLQPRDCRWPIGDPREPSFGFCGHARSEGSPYCPHHRARSSGAFLAEVA